MAEEAVDREVTTWAGVVTTLKDVARGTVTYLGAWLMD